jgi:hypothetical protein
LAVGLKPDPQRGMGRCGELQSDGEVR